MSEDLTNVMGSFIETELNAFEEIHKELEEKDKEIERLNNIINELDNFLDKKIERVTKLLSPKKGIKPYGEEKNYYEITRNRLLDVKDKLQELKGDSSNE